MFAAGLLVFSIIPLALSRPAVPRSEMVIRSQHTIVPPGFVWSGPAVGEPLRLTIAMPQNNVAGLHGTLLDVSDPLSKNYGHHLSKEEVERLVAPRPESLKAVKDWLAKHGIVPDSSSASGDTLSIRIPVEQADTLLNASFSTYVHQGTNTKMVRTLSYALPAHLHEHITFVSPTTHFIPPIRWTSSLQVLASTSVARKRVLNRRQSRRAYAPASCSSNITPACLQKLYNIPSTPATAKNNTLFVAGFGDEFADPADLATFMTLQRPDFADGTYELLSVDNVQNFNKGTVEASLDMQYTVGLATGVPNTFVSVGDTSNGLSLDQMLDMANFLLKQDTVPQVLSISFTGNEVIRSIPYIEQAQTLCNAYAQLGARGTSVIFATGDFGVGGGLGSVGCESGQEYIATFPASCPYLTAVGSTAGVNPEVGASFSAGGFSSIFPRPGYQSQAVADYLDALGNDSSGLFNRTGRAYPDVSMQGSNYAVTIGGVESLVFGTSASAPAFASIIALINDRLMNAGNRTLGFLNPLLYSKGVAAFNDITSGNNPGCGTNGFQALAGWDPVTGLGTPDFGRLLSVVLPGSAAVVAVDVPAGQQGNDNGRGTGSTRVLQDGDGDTLSVLTGFTQFLQSLSVFSS